MATFKATAEEVEKFRRDGKFARTGSQQGGPPSPPETERGVFFIGFPGDGRHMRPYRGGGLVEIEWSGYTALAIATSVSATGITLLLEHDPECDVGERATVLPDWALGGCSGAPLLTLVDHNNVYSWRLAGIIYESSETIVKVSRADCLNADATLNSYPDPMAYTKRRS